MIVGWIRYLAERLVIWAVVKQCRTHPAIETRRIATREIEALRESVNIHFEYQDREQSILTARLTRRYDVGLAMNEATVRAQEQRRKDGTLHEIQQLTPRQQAALEFQKQYLARIQRQ